MESWCLRQVWLSEVRGERSPLAEQLMRPDLAVEHQVGHDLLRELGGGVDLRR